MSRRIFCLLLVFLAIGGTFVDLRADEQAATEDDYYRYVNIPIPEGINLEVGGIAVFPQQRLAVSTRRGDIYLIDGAWKTPVEKPKFTKFAGGLHEVLGLHRDQDGSLYATQRCELSRLQDKNGDDKADVIETVTDGWEISGDYHEYAFGSDFDKQGHAWIVLCLTGSFSSKCQYRGWCVRVDREGNVIPTCSGIRSPGGIGPNAAGDMFYTDNQGPWNGTCSLKWLRPGSFQGHPGGNDWYKLDAVRNAMGTRPPSPQSGSRIMTEAGKIPEYEPPAVLFPYNKMGKSASGIACDTTNGKFGPFSGQLFVADQSFSTVMRCFLEKVDGHYQGACFPFKSGGGSGNLALKFSNDGKLFVGGTNRGWGSRGRKPFAIERLEWTGRVPFEIHEMRAKPDGFELTFTKPVDRESAAKLESYQLGTYTYIFQSSYGSPEVDHTTAKVTRADVSEDGLSVRLRVDGLQVGHVHELKAAGVRNREGQPLLHDQAYYTLNYVPNAK